jgi:hypothetical protein
MTNDLSTSCLPIGVDDLARVVGGASSSPDGTAALKRAAEQKPGTSSLDLYGYAATGTQGVGAEYRHRFTPNVSVFANGHVGTKDNVPDTGIMGGVRIDW